MTDRKIHVFEGRPFAGVGHSETCYRICRHWPALGAPTEVHTPFALRADPAGILRPLLPKNLPSGLVYRLETYSGADALRARSERRGLRRVRAGDICYFWPTSSGAAMSEARKRGAHVVIEFINCHVGFAHEKLSAEAARTGLEHDWDIAERAGEETERLGLADAAFAPGPFVGPSIRAHFDGDIDILDVSYGTEMPQSAPPDRSQRSGKPVFLFMGRLDMRKGAQTLLDAWDMANLDAELHFTGHIDAPFQARVDALASKGVRRLGFMPDPAQAYRSADVFVMPTIEEGGPQVTYEAASHGLPLLVTEMGGGHIADASTALVMPESDAEAWAAGLRRLAEDRALRLSLGAGAYAAAERFDWRTVSQARLEALLARFPG